MAVLVASALAGDHEKPCKTKHWVDIWATMPQLAESSNLPPVPFVRQLSPLCPKTLVWRLTFKAQAEKGRVTT
jgi:hypothetical protein